MSDKAPPGRPSNISDFGRAVEKLRKINAALMKRVERSMDQQANAFSLFQTAINQEAQIRLRTEELNTALTKLAHANVELSAARDVAERANVFKTKFFTAVGHDLLQPLHAARLMLSELMDAQKQPDDKQLALNISNALVTIEELLTSILDISKLEAGVFVPNIQTVALGGLFEQLASNVGPVARRKGLEIRLRPTKLAVRSDPLMLRRILQNLLANATHYTERGGVLLAARQSGDRVAIEVWDTGSGIAPQERERIFEEFERGAASARTGGAGFGLGLAIVRRMSDALGHELLLRSRFGYGTRFSVVTEYAAPLPAGETIDEALGADNASVAGKPMIVIDNDLAVLEAMQTLLSRWGADPRLARNLDDIGEILSDTAFAPAIILADYHLDEGVLGIEAVERVRNATNRKVPAILITGDHSFTIANAAQRYGCEVLHKPVRPAELRALMRHLLQ